MKNNVQLSDRNDFTRGDIWQKMLRFFLPIAAGGIFQQFYNAVDAIIVGKYVGTEALAAVGGSATTIINVLLGFFIALTSGAAVVIAQLYGAHENERISQASNTAVVFCTFLGVLISVVCVYLSPAMLKLMLTPEDTFAFSLDYLRTAFYGAASCLIYNMGSSILRAVGDSRRPFIYLAVCSVCNIVLDLVFVVNFGMEVFGVALATVISQSISALLVLIRLFTAKEIYRLDLRKKLIDFDLLGRMLKIGVPSGMQQSMYGISNTIIQVGVNKLGTVVVAAWALTGKLDGIYWVLVNSAGAAITTFVGQNFGAGKVNRIRKTVKVSFISFEIITAVCTAVFLVIGKFACGIFSDDPLVIESAVEILRYFVPFYVVWTVIEVFSGALKGCGDALVPVVIIGIFICAFRIVWVYTAFAKYMTTFCISMSYPISWVIAAIPMAIRYLRGSWKDRISDPDFSED